MVIIQILGLLFVHNYLDISGYIEADQVIRWKQEYPEWRMPKDKMKTKKLKGTNMPDFCGPNES